MGFIGLSWIMALLRSTNSDKSKNEITAKNDQVAIKDQEIESKLEAEATALQRQNFEAIIVENQSVTSWQDIFAKTYPAFKSVTVCGDDWIIIELLAKQSTGDCGWWLLFNMKEKGSFTQPSFIIGQGTPNI